MRGSPSRNKRKKRKKKKNTITLSIARLQFPNWITKEKKREKRKEECDRKRR